MSVWKVLRPSTSRIASAIHDPVSLRATFLNGQCFGWQPNGANTFTGVIGSSVVSLRQVTDTDAPSSGSGAGVTPATGSGAAEVGPGTPAASLCGGRVQLCVHHLGGRVSERDVHQHVWYVNMRHAASLCNAVAVLEETGCPSLVCACVFVAGISSNWTSPCRLSTPGGVAMTSACNK